MSAGQIHVTVNGKIHKFAESLSVDQLLARLKLPSRGIALAVDGVVFPKSRWDEQVAADWNVEVLTAVQGG
ncbi:sulfur carrier protein ThiS [Nocardia carnea]|uniref:sulfur carrier protein ThiS n=1 Tax=Nocardia carnea TaxID=37328 RepID=UPI002457C27D|nr:sulfur carrier protein ThiS [Nocardia carnea]